MKQECLGNSPDFNSLDCGVDSKFNERQAGAEPFAAGTNGQTGVEEMRTLNNSKSIGCLPQMSKSYVKKQGL